MSVPSVARAASLIKGIIASTPLEVYRDSTGEEIPAPKIVPVSDGMR